MADQFRDFIAVLEAFDRYEVGYILIGGVAVILPIFDDISIEEITFEELKKYPVIRYGTPNGFYIDIMARLGKVASFEDLEYETIAYQGIKIRIGTPETLYELKRNTVRDRDKIDAMFLKELIKAKQSSRSDQD